MYPYRNYVQNLRCEKTWLWKLKKNDFWRKVDFWRMAQKTKKTKKKNEWFTRKNLSWAKPRGNLYLEPSRKTAKTKFLKTSVFDESLKFFHRVTDLTAGIPVHILFVSRASCKTSKLLLKVNGKNSLFWPKPTFCLYSFRCILGGTWENCT